jgi:LPXTG-motif cell wall-anchored protein
LRNDVYTEKQEICFQRRKHMNKRFAMLCTMFALAMMLVGGVSAAPSRTESAQQGSGPGVTLMATLTGEAQVEAEGDPDGSGTAMVTLNTDTGEVTFDVSYANITLPTAAAHIHRGAAGVAGPVVVPFWAEPQNANTVRGRVTADVALVKEIAANPAGFYVNVHNADYPKGAIRGQLVFQPLPDTGASNTMPLLVLGGALVALLAGAGMRRVVRA